MSWKQRIAKVLFYICFIPFAALIIGSANAYLSGIEFSYSNIVGTSALVYYIIEAAKCSPLLVGCFIYQIAYWTTMKNKKQYASKNLKIFILLASIAILAGGTSFYMSEEVYEDFVKDVYQEKSYGETLIVKLPYDEKYDDTIDTTIRIRYEELFAYIYANYGDEALYPLMERFEGDFTAYMISVSPVLNGEPILNESDIRLEVNEGKKDVRLIADYRVKMTNEKYILVCITDGALNENYTVSSIWK